MSQESQPKFLSVARVKVVTDCHEIDSYFAHLFIKTLDGKAFDFSRGKDNHFESISERFLPMISRDLKL